MKSVYFEREPELQPLANGQWRLARDWQIRVGRVSMTIPAGFVTDGASVPKFLWRLCGHPMEAPRIYAAIVHDWLYSGAVAGMTRSQADGIYRDIMIGCGCGRKRSHVEWLALRLCGRSHWYKKQERKETEK